MFNITKIKDHVRFDNDTYQDCLDFISPFDKAVRKLDKHKLLIGGPLQEMAYDFYWRYYYRNKYSHAISINLQIGFCLSLSKNDDLVANILIKTTEYSTGSIPTVDYLSRKKITLEGEESIVKVAEELIEIAETYYLMDELLPKLRPSLRSKAIDLLPM